MNSSSYQPKRSSLKRETSNPDVQNSVVAKRVKFEETSQKSSIKNNAETARTKSLPRVNPTKTTVSKDGKVSSQNAELKRLKKTDETPLKANIPLKTTSSSVNVTIRSLPTKLGKRNLPESPNDLKTDIKPISKALKKSSKREEINTPVLPVAIKSAFKTTDLPKIAETVNTERGTTRESSMPQKQHKSSQKSPKITAQLVGNGSKAFNKLENKKCGEENKPLASFPMSERFIGESTEDTTAISETITDKNDYLESKETVGYVAVSEEINEFATNDNEPNGVHFLSNGTDLTETSLLQETTTCNGVASSNLSLGASFDESSLLDIGKQLGVKVENEDDFVGTGYKNLRNATNSEKTKEMTNGTSARETNHTDSKPPKAPKPSRLSPVSRNLQSPQEEKPDVETLLMRINEQNEIIRNLQRQVKKCESHPSGDISETTSTSDTQSEPGQHLLTASTEDLTNFQWGEVPPTITTNRCEPKSLDYSLTKLQQNGGGAPHSYATSLLLNANRRELHLIEENEILKGELQELRDHADLLEFRIFEFSEGIHKTSGVPLPTCHQSTSTDDVIVGTSEDLSLPFSVDSGVEVHFENTPKSRLSDYRRSLSRLSTAAPSETQSIQQLSSLLDWIASNGGSKTSPCVTPTTPLSPKMLKMECGNPLEATKVGDDHRLDIDLAALASRLQESLEDPGSHEAALVEAVSKLQVYSTSLVSLQSKVASLTAENTNLTNAVSALSEAHETRTEASATESDQVHRKSPSYPSDLSDTESDESPRPHRQKRLQDLSTSFQESGIFEAEEGGVNTSTQTEGEFHSLWLENQSKICTCIQADPLAPSLEDQTNRKNSVQSDVDLQTAIARLTSIKDVVQESDIRNFKIHELQENDEFVSPDGDGHITLLKAEYDHILSNERNLTRELEIVQCEKDQMANQIASLDEQLRKALKNDVSEVLRGEIRVLEQRLEASEHYRRQFFDEKCEFEEAENDARLLSQRLDSQLEAAHEMESLLSASLSQEQEFSRELQRRVRELQMIDKGRRIHEEVLETEARTCREREAAALVANERYISKLTFILCGLVLAQLWRSLASSRDAKAVVSYSPPTISSLKTLIMDMTQWINSNLLGDYATIDDTTYGSWCNLSPSEQEIKESFDVDVGEFSDMELSDDKVNVELSSDEPDIGTGDVLDRPSRYKGCDIFNDSNSLLVNSTNKNKFDDIEEESTSFDGTTSTALCYVSVCDSFTQTDKLMATAVACVQCDEDAFPECNGVTPSKLSAPEDQSELSDREAFYLGQIESLQSEKRAMRKDFESEHANVYRQLQDLENQIEMLTDAWKSTESEKQELLFKIEETQNESLESERTLQRRTKELKEDLRTSIDVLNREQEVLQRQYEERLEELRARNEEYEERIAVLMQQFAAIKAQLGTYINEENGTEDGVFSNLVSAIRLLLRSEAAYKQKVEDLEDKDRAYQETIKEADRLMSSHMTIYTGRIEELEASLAQKNSRISQLESSEGRLRSSMRRSKKSSEDAERISELLDKLLETENSELALKERVWNLERSEKELRIKLVEGEKQQQGLKAELRDQDEMVQRLMTLTTENNDLSSQLQEAHECSRKAAEMQQSENYLKGRVEELELSESALRDAVREVEKMSKLKERKVKEQSQMLQEEVYSLKGQLEKETLDANQLREVESNLRGQLEEHRERAAALDKEISDTQQNESQHRAEVTRLRSQINLCNNQLSELDALNCEVREKLALTEEAMKQVVSQLEDRSRRHESEVLSLNLQLSEKDAKIEDCETQISALTHGSAADEFECFSLLPVDDIKSSLNGVVSKLKNCSTCKVAGSEDMSTLVESVKTLNDIVNGKGSGFDSDSEEVDVSSSKDLQEEGKVESVIAIGNQTSPNASSCDENASKSCNELDDVERSPSKSSKPIPPVPPRPRRDAKRKRRSRPGDGSMKNHRKLTEGSLMDELEEGVFGTSPGSFKVLEELEDRIRQLESEVAMKEEELKLADAESAELHARLIEGDEELTRKDKEISDLNITLSGLRNQLLSTVHEYEHSKNSVEAQHKVMIESLNEKMEALASALSALGERTVVKDAIISTLVNQIKDILRCGNLGVAITQIRLLGSCEKNLQRSDYPDFDIVNVCQLMTEAEQVHEARYDKQSSVESEDKLDILHQSLPPMNMGLFNEGDMDKANALKANATRTIKALPPLSNKKSRIPLLRPSSVPPIKIDLTRSKLQTKLDQFKKSLRPMKEEAEVSSAKRSTSSGRLEPRHLKPLAKVPPKQRPTAAVTPTRAKLPKTPATAYGRGRKDSAPKNPSACSLSSGVSPPAKKECSKPPKMQGKFISDARKVKRMVLGVSSLNASVECPAAPEWAQSTPNLSVHAPAPACIPRPTDLRITRRVGIDGAVIAWAPLDHDCIQGFQVMFNEKVVQVVRSPHRTKALVTGLPFPEPFTVALVAVSHDGRVSLPTMVTHERTNVYKTSKTTANNKQVVPSPSALHLPVHTAIRAAIHSSSSKRALPTCL